MTSPVLSTSDPRAARRDRRGFTLVELLLVLAIVGILTAVTLPSFVRSIRGNRMRAAVRTVVSAGRYARAAGVMEQCRMALEFDLEKSSVTVLRLDAAPDETGPEPAADVEALPDGGAARPRSAGVVEVVRVLDGVTLEKVERGTSRGEGADGRVRVLYGGNGRNEPYTVRLRDAEGQSVEVNVDALGGAETREG